MSQVPLKRTPISMAEYARGLVRAWQKDLRVVPTKQAAGVLWAQYMIETGGAACWNWNIGNVKVTAGQVDAGVDWHDLPGTWEIIAGKRVVLPDGHPGRRFRAFASLDEAMAHHLGFLRNKRYAVAWPAVEAGDVMQFARLLKSAGYFTASAEDYGTGMGGHFRAWMASQSYENAVAALLVELDAPTLPVMHDEDDGEGTPTKTVPQMRPPPFERVTVIHPAIEFQPKVYNLDEDPDDDAA
jgi:hypothetical protein